MKNTLHRVKEDLELSSELGFRLALKIVRGAYLEHETKRANSLGYESPTFGSYEETGDNYDRHHKQQRSILH